MASKQSKDDDERYETEEFYVYVDLDTKLLDEQLSKSNTKVKFLGIDTQNPIMQLNNQLFKGNFDYSMGTHCFFTESKKHNDSEDACFNEMPKQMYEYYAKTDKVLKMKRIFVEEKESETDSEMTDSDIDDLEHLRISKTYEEALNQFLKPGEKPPREITQDLQDSDEDAAAEMEVDPNLEEPSDEAKQAKGDDGDSGEHSLNLTAVDLLQTKEEAKEQEEQLIDPDYEPGRSD